MIALLALGAAPAAQEPDELLEQARSDLDREALGPARRGFEAVLASEPSYWHPLAEIGLATLLRLDGRPGAGLTRLEPPRRRLDAWLADPATTNEVVLQGRRELHEEAGRCLLALGVLDRAAAEFAALERCCRRSEPAERFLAGLAWIDLHLAQRDHRRAIARSELLLGDAAVRAAVPGAEAALAPRLAAARLRNGADRTAASAIAAQLQGWFAAAAPGTARHRLLGLELVDAHALAGADEAAWAVASAMVQGPFENAQRETEIRARHARLALQRSQPGEQLAELRRALESSFGALLRDWADTPLRPGGMGTLQFDQRLAAVGTLLALDCKVEGASSAPAAYEHLEAVLAMGTLARRLQAPRVPWDSIRGRLLPERGCLLHVSLTHHHGSVVLIDDDGATHECVDLDGGFWANCESFLTTIGRGADRSADASARCRELGTRLRDRLLSPRLASRLDRCGNVLLVGHEEQTSLLQALPWQEEWIATRFAVLHVPSVGLAMALRQRPTNQVEPSPPRLDLLVIGDPEVAPSMVERFGVGRLGVTAAERERLTAAYPRDRTGVFWGRDATVAAVREHSVTAKAMLLLAHGVLDPRTEHAAAIALAPSPAHDGALTGDVLAAMKLPPLVVLGVCNAGDGPGRRGDDGVHHLGGACLAAGADCAILAQGDLAAGATIDLLDALLQELVAGHDVPESLRRARARIASDPRRRHPYFFLGLRATGVDRQWMR